MAPRAPTPLPPASVGVGWRVELAADLLASPRSVDFVEVVAEACFSSPAARREAQAIAELWPVVPHGVKLSLGSAEGIDLDRARRLGALARDLGAPVVTEHVAFVRAGSREIGHLTPLPYTEHAAGVVARNAAAARKVLPDVPLLLENVAWTFRWPEDAMSEGSFYAEVVEQTGLDLLLDVGNLYASAVNAGVDPIEFARDFPIERARMIHLAGGVTEDGFYFDTHAHAVPEVVFRLLEHVLGRVGPVPVVIERDDRFPPFAEIAGELDRARAIVSAAASVSAPAPAPAPAPVWNATPDRPAIAEAQARLARMLTSMDPPGDVGDFDARAIARSREVLRRKRVDDALPLLGRLAPYRESLKAIALACVDAAPRAPALAGVADAMRIAAAAAADPRFEAAARLDLLALRSRFVGPAEDGSLRPRFGPFVGRERLSGGRVVWALKGPGGAADVRFFERKVTP